MAKWCLTKQASENFKEALRTREIDPFKLAEMESVKRRDFLEKYVGPENSKQVNALFESKLLLKNQKAGYISWAKKVTGITPEVRRDILAKIERMDSVLDPADQKAFLQDLASSRLGIEITATEGKAIAEMSRKVVETEGKWQETLNKNPEWQKNPLKTRKEWLKNQDRLEYGLNKVMMEKYINELKLDAQKVSFKEQPLRKIAGIVKEVPGALKSVVASLDNSFWGRQGIKVLMDPRTSKIWFRNFAKSWGDAGRQLRGIDAIDAIRADIYSRPNALNGKYKAGGYGLDVLSEEAFPSSVPEKIPAFGRLFKASEAMYNGAALRLRADLADRLIAKAEAQGINVLDPVQAQGMGNLVSSITGRGKIQMTPGQAKATNVLFFSIKFMKSNFDTLTAHMLDPKASRFVKIEAAKNLVSIAATTTAVLTIAKMLDPESVTFDPKDKNFGKVKVFGKPVDITGGMGAWITMSTRVADKIGQTIKGEKPKFGEPTGLDILENFFEGKLSPFAGILRDYMEGKTRAGLPVTPLGELQNVTFPISAQNLMQLSKDPDAESVLGLMLLDGLGFSVSAYPQPNEKSKAIPLNKRMSEGNLIDTISVYSQAMGADPVTTFDRIFTGQKVRRVDGGAVIVERMSVGESQAEKRRRGKENPEVKLDHTIPLELGGSNDSNNLKIVTNAQHRSYTKVENALGRALKANRISKKDAQAIIKKFKSIEETKDRNAYGEEIINRYK